MGLRDNDEAMESYEQVKIAVVVDDDGDENDEDDEDDEDVVREDALRAEESAAGESDVKTTLRRSNRARFLVVSRNRLRYCQAWAEGGKEAGG